MIIHLDMDGVAANLDKPWLDAYNRDFDDDLTADQITAYDITRFVKPEARGVMQDYLGRPGMYYDAPPYPGAVQAVRKLEEQGHLVFFLTAPFLGERGKQSRHVFYDKTRWVGKHFPWIDPGRVIFTGHKYLVFGHVLLEDNPEKLKGFMGRKVVMTRPWNKGFDAASIGADRVGSWKEFVWLVENGFQSGKRKVAA